jgi:hypothetical protein
MKAPQLKVRPPLTPSDHIGAPPALVCQLPLDWIFHGVTRVIRRISIEGEDWTTSDQNNSHNTNNTDQNSPSSPRSGHGWTPQPPSEFTGYIRQWLPLHIDTEARTTNATVPSASTTDQPKQHQSPKPFLRHLLALLYAQVPHSLLHYLSDFVRSVNDAAVERILLPILSRYILHKYQQTFVNSNTL